MHKANERSLFATPCKDCVFAQYMGSTQVGCMFGRIEKFRRQGVKVLEVFDEDSKFFVIQTACRAHRHRESPWAMRHPGRERLAVCRKELELALDVVMVMHDQHTVEEVKTTVDSLLAQTLLPMKVTVVVNRDGIPPQEIRAILPSDWVAQYIQERQPDGSRIGPDRCIDHAVVGSRSQFYAVFTPGYVVPPDFAASLDRALNDDLERFLLLEPNEDGQGMVVSMLAHAYYGGNTEAVIEGQDAGEDAGRRVDSIGAKIRHRVKIEDTPQFVSKITDVCPELRRTDV